MIEKVIPRNYQNDLFTAAQTALTECRSICIEAPTGSGKSVLLAMIIDAIHKKNERLGRDARVYIVVHQHFLLQQMSDHLDKWRVPHGLITGGKYERPGVNTHVCTIQSLARRPPEKPPALIIIDEAHRSGAASYLALSEQFPQAKIIGVTASPERSDGKGLSVLSGGIFERLIRCPLSMIELTEMEYLVPIKYYAPPLPGIESVAIRMGDYSPDDIEQFLLQKGVYGDAVKHYRKIADGLKCLVFCKSVKACYDFADTLNAEGYRAAPLEGSQGKKKRREILNRFESGELTHITTCKLVLEGFDMPSIEAVLDLAPTLSRSLWHQKKGRVARPADGKTCGIYIDPVGNVAQCTDTGDIYEVVDWRFDGSGYNKKDVSQEAVYRYCPICYAFIPSGNICPECGAKKEKPPEKPVKKMEGELVEVAPVALRDRDDEDRRSVQESIKVALHDEDIKQLYEIAITVTEKRKAALWVYHKMNEKKHFVDVELLYRIQRELGYKPGWVHFARKTIKGD